MRRTLAGLLFFITLAMGGTALAQVPDESLPQPDESAAPQVAEVLVLDDRFVQSRLTVKPGTTVTWVHRGNNFHSSSAIDGGWDSGAIQRGDTFSFTFMEPGSYPYLCRQHVLQGMRGTISVEPE